MVFLENSRLPRRPIDHQALGRMRYADALDLQRRLWRLRAEGRIADRLLTVEHDPVFTIGRRGSLDNLLVSEEALRAEGIELFEIERGGDITYHGPGQLVAYPILDLREYDRDVRKYVGGLEEAILRTLDAFGIVAGREAGRPGVWVEGRKIASIGVHVRRWVTMHGLALNVEIAASHFAMIRPCGLDVRTVSMADLLGDVPSLGAVCEVLVDRTSEVFGWRVRSIDRIEQEERGVVGSTAVG